MPFFVHAQPCSFITMNDLLSSDVSGIEAEGGLTHLFYISVVL